VKYLLMIYANPVNWGHPVFLRTPAALELSEAERAELAGELSSLLDELRSSGELVSVAALAEPRRARTVRVRHGAVIATDGPFGESKEQMAGAFVIDCATVERAEEIAARWPDARFGTVELRPIESSAEHDPV
jgi:hypothetical protein